MLLSKIIRRNFASGQLLTWGESTYGWGRPANTNYFTPAPVDGFKKVQSVSTGQYHLGFITNDNSVYTVGLNENGQLGQGSSSDSDIPRKIALDSNTKVTSISCGTNHSLALTSDGAVYSWGFKQALGVQSVAQNDVPVRIPQQHFQNSKIVSVSAAKDFSVALCQKGVLYAWGDGLALLPTTESPPLTPRPFKLAQDLISKRHTKIKKFAAIDQFIMLLLDNGRLYGYGNNSAGVFGARLNPLIMSDNKLRTFARTYDELYKNEKIVDFEASSNSLIFRTETDRIFYNGMFDKYQPTPFPVNVKAKRIFATGSSVGVITEDNKVYYLNQKFIDDSELICQKNRVFFCQDPTFASEVFNIGGSYNLKYALVK